MRKVVANAAHQRISQLITVGGRCQLGLFFRVADEGGFDQHAGNVWRFEHGETGLLYAGLVQLGHTANLTQQRGTELETVLDLRGGAHVQQHALHMLVLHAAHIQAADQVSLIFLVGQPARCRAGGAAFAERKHAGAASGGRGEGVGMNADEQVGLHAAGFFHAGGKRHKEVGIARHHGAHGAAANAGVVDALAQQVGHFEHHIFFAQAAGAGSTGVFAAVAWVQHHDDDAVRALRGSDIGRRTWRGCWGGRRPWGWSGRLRNHGGGCGDRNRRRCRHTLVALGNQVAQRVSLRCGGNDGWWRCGDQATVRGGCGGDSTGATYAACIAQAFADQCLQRVHRLGGVQVQHQAVFVGCNRGEGKDLGAGFLLEVDDQSHHAGRELAHADAGDIRVVGANLGHQLFQSRVQVQPFHIHGKAWWGGNEDGLGCQRNIGFQRDARIVGGGPDAHGHDAGPLRNMLAAQQQDDAACLQQVAPGQTEWSRGGVSFAHAVNASSTVQPAGVPALSVTCRCTSSIASIWIAISATGVTAAAFSGHSASLSPGLAKMSRKPASSHSRGSSKR